MAPFPQVTALKQVSGWEHWTCLWPLWAEHLPKDKLWGSGAPHGTGEGSKTSEEAQVPPLRLLQPPPTTHLASSGEGYKVTELSLGRGVRQPGPVEYKKAASGCFLGTCSPFLHTYSRIYIFFLKIIFYNFNITSANTFRFIDQIFCYEAKHLKVHSNGIPG